MKNQKGFAWLPALLGLLAILSLGGVYVYQTQKMIILPEPIYTPDNSTNPTTQTTTMNNSAQSIPSGEDITVKNILIKETDDRYPGFTVPAGVVVDPSNFMYAGYYMKTAGQFYKDSKYLYWVVFPEPLYDISFSITRVPNGDPATFHSVTTGSFDGMGYAADKNQFYCGPRPFSAINPSEARVVVENGHEIVIAGSKKYKSTASSDQIVKDPTKTCELITSQ